MGRALEALGGSARLVAEPGSLRIAGSSVVVAGDRGLLDSFETVRPFTRDEIRRYAEDLRESRALHEVERAYDDLIALLRMDVLPRRERPGSPAG